MIANPLPVLIVGYSRLSSLIDLVRVAIESESSPIYVAIDGPTNDEIAKRQEKIINLLQKIRDESQASIKIVYRNQNLGSGAGVVNALNWFFEEEEAGIVLEDDLIVDQTFFTYMNEIIPFMETDAKVLLASGTRLRETKSEGVTLCSYPVVWGWATTRQKWEVMKMVIFQESQLFNPSIPLQERLFWRTGKRRALNSQIDAWDIPLAAGMRTHGYMSLVPPANLVSNMGFDSMASHTTDEKWPLLLKRAMDFPSQNKVDYSSLELNLNDAIMRSRIFGITKMNIVSGIISLVIDPLRFKHRRDIPSLLERAKQGKRMFL